MEVKINKEIRDYTEKVYFGLTLRQFIFAVISCIVAVGLYFGLKNVFNKEILSWICILGACPFIAIGFIKYNGLNFENFIISFLKTEFLVSKQLVFKPINFYEVLIRESEEEKNDKKIRKIFSKR